MRCKSGSEDGYGTGDQVLHSRSAQKEQQVGSAGSERKVDQLSYSGGKEVGLSGLRNTEIIAMKPYPARQEVDLAEYSNSSVSRRRELELRVGFGLPIRLRPHIRADRRNDR